MNAKELQTILTPKFNKTHIFSEVDFHLVTQQIACH